MYLRVYSIAQHNMELPYQDVPVKLHELDHEV